MRLTEEDETGFLSVDPYLPLCEVALRVWQCLRQHGCRR
jgi:hypothetical protein